MLTHESGQYVSDETELPSAVLHGSSGKNPVQVLGSAITYMRRYNYAAILGMAQEDDDGASANDAKPATKSPNDDKPWYNEPNYQADIEEVTAAIRGGTPPDDIIEKICLTFKMSSKYRNLIKSI